MDEKKKTELADIEKLFYRLPEEQIEEGRRQLHRTTNIFAMLIAQELPTKMKAGALHMAKYANSKGEFGFDDESIITFAEVRDDGPDERYPAIDGLHVLWAMEKPMKPAQFVLLAVLAAYCEEGHVITMWSDRLLRLTGIPRNAIKGNLKILQKNGYIGLYSFDEKGADFSVTVKLL